MRTSTASRPSSRVWAVALVGQVLIAGLLMWAVPTSAPVGARLLVVAPPVVSTALVDQVARLDRRFDAVAVASPRAALAAVRRGRADAAVVVDLSADRDALYVSAASGARGRTGIANAASRVSAGLGRTLQVETVPIRADRRTPYVVVLLSLVLGFAAAVIVTWRRGTFEATFRAGVARFAGFALLGTVAGLAYVPAPWPARVLVMALVLAAGIVTTALTVLIGVLGLAASSLLFVLTAAPLARLTPTMLIPQPWQGINGWFLQGAGLDLANDILLFGHGGSARDWAVVAAWLGVAALALTVARARRAADPAQARPAPLG